MTRPALSDAFARLRAAARERILILDGAMGTEIQTLGLSEDDYAGCGCGHDHGHGHGHAGDKPQKGNNDLLNLTRP